MTTRVGTYASHLTFVNQMLVNQQRIYDGQNQLATEKKSQTYAGLEGRVQDLVGFESEYNRVKIFKQNNAVADTRLAAQEQVVANVTNLVREFRNKLLDLSSNDVANGLTPEEQNLLEDIQRRAFDAMKQVTAELNTKVGDEYIFAGGKVNTKPVDFTFANLDAFQNKYHLDDGTGSGTAIQPYPITQAQHTSPGATTITTFGQTSSTALNAYHSSYYDGDELQTKHRLSEDTTITLGVNAIHPGFEKALRAMGMMAQGQLTRTGNLDEAQQIISEALKLVNDALRHDESELPSESDFDLEDLHTQIASNRVQIKNQKIRDEDTMSYLGNQVINIENINKTEVAVKLNHDLSALEISYTTLGRIQGLSLANYMR